MKAIARVLALYTGAAALSGLLLVFALRLWQADLGVPMHYGWDTLTNLAWVKGVAENGWFLFNPSLGAPFELDMRDFPLLDNLHFLLIKLLALTTHDPAVLVNAFFFLTFPLTTLTTLWTIRRYSVSAGPALVGSLLYTFVPYHFFRGEAHLFLSAYYLVPPMTAVVLDLFLDRGAVLRCDSLTGKVSWNLRSSPTWTALVVCLLVGGAGAYYAFFGLFFLCVAGLMAAWRLRRLYPLVAAALLCGLLFLSCTANAAPALIARSSAGINPETAHRQVWEAEAYGLRLTALFAPVSDHYVPWLARIARRYQVELADRINQRGAASLGLVGCAGFIFLMMRLLPRRDAARQEPLWNTDDVPCSRDAESSERSAGRDTLRSEDSASRLHALAWLTLFALLLGLCGGGGLLFNFTITPIIRCYNRISIYIAFFCLFAVALLLDRLCRSLPGKLLGHGALALILAAGFLDQTGWQIVPNYAHLRQNYRLDAAFFARVEAAVPAGTMIFQLPYMAFPEAPPRGQIACSYEHLRGYIHSRTLRWSYGGMRGRYGDVWHARLAELPAPELLDSLVLAGFGGLLFDRQGESADREEMVKNVLHLQAIESFDRRLAFYPLSGRRERLEHKLSPEEWRQKSEEVRLPILPTWQGEVSEEERIGPDRCRWIGAEAVVTLHNPSPRRQRIHLQFTLLPPPGGGHRREVHIEGRCSGTCTPFGGRNRWLLACWNCLPESTSSDFGRMGPVDSAPRLLGE